MTWSIVAHDPASGAFAVAVATKAFAVGASCPFVRSGVGAVSTQSFTNRYLAPAILDAMARGLPPDAAIEGALAGDAGRGIRQVHAVDQHGRTAAWTGQNCVEWCGSVAAPGISVAGNMLAGEPTIAATLEAWQAYRELELPERLRAKMDVGEMLLSLDAWGGRIRLEGLTLLAESCSRRTLPFQSWLITVVRSARLSSARIDDFDLRPFSKRKAVASDRLTACGSRLPRPPSTLADAV